MPRTLSAAIQSVIAQNKSSIVHLLLFGPVNGTTYYFGEDLAQFNGHSYLPHLIVDGPIKYTQKLQRQPVTVKLQNVTLEMAAIVNAQKAAIQGAHAILYRLFLPVNDSITLFDGLITEVDVDEQTVSLTLDTDLDPTASDVPVRQYAALCAWNFKDANCGYVDGVSPNDPGTGLPYTVCGKDFASCTARARTQNFSGFIHISRDLTLLYEGQQPDAVQAA